MSEKTITKATKADCAGCRDDYYNHDGNSTTGECWMLKDARIRPILLIPINAPPPYDRNATVEKPSCYHPPRTARVDPSALTSDGYWRS